MNSLFEYFSIIIEGLTRLNHADLNMTLVVAICVGILTWVGCNFYTRLWNKGFHLNLGYKVLTLVSSLLSMIFIFMFVGSKYMKEVSLSKISTWKYQILNNDVWANETFNLAYIEVKKSGLEDFTNYPVPDGRNNRIPITKKESVISCSEVFAKQACKNFDNTHAFLSKIIWSKSGIPSDSVKKDIETFYSNQGVGFSDFSNIQGAEAVINTNSELEKRKEMYGAINGEIEITLSWDNENDLDLHAVDPSGFEISFRNKHSNSGGALDVDKNPSCMSATTEPIEHIYYPVEGVLNGTYKVILDPFKHCGSSPDPSPYKCIVQMKGNIIKQDSGTIRFDERNKLLFEFSYPGTATIPTFVPKPYNMQNAIQLVANTIELHLKEQTPKTVFISRTILIILFLLVELIPLSLIGIAAYKDLKVHA